LHKTPLLPFFFYIIQRFTPFRQLFFGFFLRFLKNRAIPFAVRLSSDFFRPKFYLFTPLFKKILKKFKKFFKKPLTN